MLFDFQGDGCDPHYPGPQWSGSLPPRLSGTLLYAVQERSQSSRHHYCKLHVTSVWNHILYMAKCILNYVCPNLRTVKPCRLIQNGKLHNVFEVSVVNIV